MAYTTPPTFVAAATLTAAELNILSDDIIDLDARAKQTRFTGVSLSRTAAQSIADTSFTALSWTSASIEVDNWWTSGTNVVVPAAAIPSGYTTIYVEIHGQTRAASNGTGTRAIQFKLNGTLIELAYNTSALTGETTAVQHTVWAEVAATNIITMEVYQTSGGALDFTTSSLKVKRLGPGA